MQQYIAACHNATKVTGPWTQRAFFKRTWTTSGSKGSIKRSSDFMVFNNPLTTKLAKGTLPMGFQEFFLKDITALRSPSTIFGEAVSSDLATMKRQMSISESVQGSTLFLVQNVENRVHAFPYALFVEGAYAVAAN